MYALAQISLFSWADLRFVIPCTASSYALTTMLGEFVLGEHVHWARWVGVLLITGGVALVAETPVTTKAHPRRMRHDAVEPHSADGVQSSAGDILCARACRREGS